MTTEQENKSLEEAFRLAINKHSRENVSNTPDFILARYLLECLKNFEETHRTRENWHYDKTFSV